MMKKSLLMGSLGMAAAALPALAADSYTMPTDWTLQAAGYNSAGSLAGNAPTEAHVYGWLNAKNDGWYASTGNGDMRWGHGSIDAATQTVHLPNMSGTAGLTIALKASVDLTDVNLTTLSFNYTMSETNNANQTYTLWYETTGGTVVQLDKVADAAGASHSYTLTADQLAAINTDGTGEFYAVFGYSGSGNTADITGISMTATTAAAAIPEPATATLSLLALAGLAARRRRTA